MGRFGSSRNGNNNRKSNESSSYYQPMDDNNDNDPPPEYNVNSSSDIENDSHPNYTRKERIMQYMGYNNTATNKDTTKNNDGRSTTTGSRSSKRNNNKKQQQPIVVDPTHLMMSEDTTSSYDNDHPNDEVYIVKQKTAYASIVFSFVQTIILGLMMWQCGIAPLKLNPMIGPYPDALSEWGGKNAVLIIDDHEYYRFVTPILLHAGIIHLLGNILVQLETGAFFEKEWGTVRWLIVYIGSAIGSTAASTIFMPNAVSVGSSGAVMGLFGGKLSEIFLRSCNRITTKQDQIAAEVRKEQCCAVSCSVVLILAFSFIPFVDWAAHAGGLVFGIILGLLLFASDVYGICWKIVWFIIGVAIAVAAYTVSILYIYSGAIQPIDELRDVCGYYSQNFDNYECNCMRDEYNFANNNNNNNNGGGNN